MESSGNEMIAVAREISRGEDYFDRLPDDLIVSHILGKIPDAKFLFSCFLLSKRLAFLVLQAHTISCTILHWLPSYIDVSTTRTQSLPYPKMKKLLRALKKPVRFLGGLFQNSRDFHLSYLVPLLRFIMAFRFLKFLYAEVSFSGKMKNSSSSIPGPIPKSSIGPVFKWKVEFKPQNSGNMTIFLAKSLASLATSDEEDNDEEEVQSQRQIFKQRCIFRDVAQDAQLRLMVFELMGNLLPDQLQRIVITDSRKQGKVVLGEGKLVELRRRDMVIKDNDVRIKVWNRRVVRLPLAGYVMKGVTVFAMKFGAVDNTDEDVESIAKDAFEGEGEVFGEALDKMLKKPASVEEHVTVLI